MGLKILKGRDGKPRPTWYARFTRNGRKVDVNLRVPLRGKVPTATDECGRAVFDADGDGDAAFAKSRDAAKLALAAMEKAAKRTGDTEAVRKAKTADLARRYYRAREGKSVEAANIRLADLPKLWRGLARSYVPTAGRMEYYDLVFRRFADFAGECAAAVGGKCETVNEITGEIATAYFNRLRTQYAWETVKGQMSLLSGAFTRWATNGEPNPFRGIIKRSREEGAAKVRRRPLSDEELRRLFEAAEGDDFLSPLITCAACTGMRIGDVCRLKWADVDLRGGFIECETAKAGVRVTIPIFPRLKAVLDDLAADVETMGGEYVFPLAAAKYNHLNAQGKPDRRDGIIRAVKPLFALAVYGDELDVEMLAGDSANAKTPDEIRSLIEGASFAPQKKARVLDTYRRFAGGATYAEIAAATGRCKAVVSQDLEAVEDLVGVRLRPGDAGTARRSDPKSKRELVKRTRQKRKIGKCSASVYGWHSLRTSFVTLALRYGVDVETVRKIVGHSATRMTLEYDRPTRQHAAEAVRRRMAGSALDLPQIPDGATLDVGEDSAPAALPPA